MIEECVDISDCEKKLLAHIEKVNLVSEIVLSNDDIDKLGTLIKKELWDFQQGFQFLKTEASTCLACFLVWKGILDYNGDYWSVIRNSLNISDSNQQNKLGDIFLEFITLNKLYSFKIIDQHNKYVAQILAHGMMPDSCLYEYFEKILNPLIDNLTNIDDGDLIKFWLQNHRKEQTDLNGMEKIIENLIFQKNEIMKNISANEFKLNALEATEKNETCVHKKSFDDENKFKSELLNLHKQIETIEEKLKAYKSESEIFSDFDKHVLDNSEYITQCNNSLLEFEKEDISLNELVQLQKSSSETLEKQTSPIFSRKLNKKDIAVIRNLHSNDLNVDIKDCDDLYETTNILKTIYNWVDYVSWKDYIVSSGNNTKKKTEIQFISKEVYAILKKLPINKEQFDYPEKLIKSIKLIKQNLEEIEAINKKINNLNEKRRNDFKKTRKNLIYVANILGINVTCDISRNIICLQNKLSVAEKHKQNFIELEYKITNINVQYNKLIVEKQVLIENYNNTESKPPLMSYRDEKSETECLKNAKNCLFLEIESLRNDLEHTEKEIKELRNKKKQIPLPFYYVDKPVRRFLLYGGWISEDFLNQSVQMISKKKKGLSNYGEIHLQERIIDKFESWWDNRVPIWFRESDLINPSGLMMKLQEAKEPISFFLRENFSDKMQSLINGFDASNHLSKDVQIILIEELNRIIQNYDIYKDLFSQIELSDETLGLIDANPSGDDLIRLNRILLEEAYFKDLAENEESAQKEKFRRPVISFNEEKRKIMVCFHSQRIKIHGENPEDAQIHIVMKSSNANLHDTKLELDRFNFRLYNTDEEIYFDISEPSEGYEFQLKNETEILKQWEFTGLSDDHPFLAFDYDSGKLISEDILPEGRVLLISNQKLKFEFENVDFIHEPGNLLKNWKEYLYRPVNISRSSKIVLDDGKTRIVIRSVPDVGIEPVLYGDNFLKDAYSNSNRIYIGRPPSIKIPVKNIEEKRRWGIMIIQGNESTLTRSCHGLIDLEEVTFENGMMEIPLSNEKLMDSSPAGEVAVHLIKGNKDILFRFSILPHLKYKFSEQIYLPTEDKSEVHLDIDDLEKDYWIPQNPAKIIPNKQNTTKTYSTQDNINGILKYPLPNGSFISIPITFHIPRLTWHIEGLRYNKYSMNSNKIIEISEDDWISSIENNLSLTVNLPYFAKGEGKLTLRSPIQYSPYKKIEDCKVTFNLNLFNSTIKDSPESLLSFKFNLSNSNILKNVPLFAIRKWQIKNIEWEPKSYGSKRILKIKWKEEGGRKDKIISLWKLEDETDKSKKVFEKYVDDSSESVDIEINKEGVHGWYLIHLTKQYYSNANIFPGESSPNTEKIYIEKSGAWDFLKNVNNNLKIYEYVIKEFQLNGNDVLQLGDIVWQIKKMNNAYQDQKIQQETPSKIALSFFKDRKIEFENEVRKLLAENDDPKIRDILKLPNIETNNNQKDIINDVTRSN